MNEDNNDSETSASRHPHYVDIAQLYIDGFTAGPQPEYCTRNDGHKLFYASQLNIIYGDPEAGKTWIALAAAVEAIRAGKRVLVVDLDHNGPSATISRLEAMGANKHQLVDPDLFRYIEPEDHTELRLIVDDMNDWVADLIVIDSLGELMPMFGLKSNDADDFTRCNAQIIKPLTRTGAAVILLDHMAKGAASRSYGAGGTVAKWRAVGGSYLRVVVNDQFTKGHGGSATLTITKDRHSGVREHAKQASPEPIAAIFELSQDGDELHTTFRAPGDHDTAPSFNAREPKPPRLGDTMAKVIEYVNGADKEVGPKDVADALNISSNTAAQNLKRALDLGHIGQPAYGRYSSVIPVIPVIVDDQKAPTSNYDKYDNTPTGSVEVSYSATPTEGEGDPVALVLQTLHPKDAINAKVSRSLIAPQHRGVADDLDIDKVLAELAAQGVAVEDSERPGWYRLAASQAVA